MIRRDHVSLETRSAIMRAVKSRGGKSTERVLRATLVAAGLRGWRMHVATLPGTPDFIFPSVRLAIFIDGCFWHGCLRCYRRPATNRAYWDQKLIGNLARDRRVNRELRARGWAVKRVWEHRLASPVTIVREIRHRLAVLGKQTPHFARYPTRTPG